jgi:hypothetical protein
MLTRTGHRGDNSTEVLLFDATLNGVLAIGRRAPFEAFSVIHIGTSEENLVSRYLSVIVY